MTRSTGGLHFPQHIDKRSVPVLDEGHDLIRKIGFAGPSGNAVSQVSQFLNGFQRDSCRFQLLDQVLPSGIHGDAVIGHEDIDRFFGRGNHDYIVHDNGNAPPDEGGGNDGEFRTRRRIRMAPRGILKNSIRVGVDIDVEMDVYFGGAQNDDVQQIDRRTAVMGVGIEAGTDLDVVDILQERLNRVLIESLDGQ